MPASQAQFEGFCLGDASATDPYQSDQKCVNWYPEVLAQASMPKTIVALLGCPGLIQVATAVGL